MPLVLAEGELGEGPEPGAARPSRRLARGGLTLFCAVVAFLIAAPLAPLVRPVKVQAFGHVALAGTTILSSAGGMPATQGFSTLSAGPVSETEDFEGVTYVMSGPSHALLLRIKNWVYYLGWFRGHRK